MSKTRLLGIHFLSLIAFAIACNNQQATSENAAKAFSNRGVEYEANGNLDKAIESYTEAIRINPKSALGG